MAAGSASAQPAHAREVLAAVLALPRQRRPEHVLGTRLAASPLQVQAVVVAAQRVAPSVREPGVAAGVGASSTEGDDVVDARGHRMDADPSGSAAEDGQPAEAAGPAVSGGDLGQAHRIDAGQLTHRPVEAGRAVVVPRPIGRGVEVRPLPGEARVERIEQPPPSPVRQVRGTDDEHGAADAPEQVGADPLPVPGPVRPPGVAPTGPVDRSDERPRLRLERANPALDVLLDRVAGRRERAEPVGVQP